AAPPPGPGRVGGAPAGVRLPYGRGHLHGAAAGRVAGQLPVTDRAQSQRLVAAAARDARALMRILLLSNMYPSRERPEYGVFVQRLAEALRARGHELDEAVLPAGPRRRAQTTHTYP